MIINLAIFAFGLIVLVIGGDRLVKGSSQLARTLGVNPIIIGLTIVAFGTSSPEFLVCLVAAVKNSSDIAIGNIVGSNISNIGLILGVSAAIRPLSVHSSIARVQTPIMIALTVFLIIICYSGLIGRLEGLVAFMSLPVFVFHTYKKSVTDQNEILEEKNKSFSDKHLRNIVYILVGLLALIIGARLVVDSSIALARSLGVSELVIGVTAVAVGTSLPELSTSIVGAIKNEHELVLGNVIGSNIFNIGILGFVSFLQPITINPALFILDLPVMLFLSVLILPFMKTGSVLSRKEGALILFIYGVFIFLLF